MPEKCIFEKCNRTDTEIVIYRLPKLVGRFGEIQEKDRDQPVPVCPLHKLELLAITNFN